MVATRMTHKRHQAQHGVRLTRDKIRLSLTARVPLLSRAEELDEAARVHHVIGRRGSSAAVCGAAKRTHCVRIEPVDIDAQWPSTLSYRQVAIVFTALPHRCAIRPARP